VGTLTADIEGGAVPYFRPEYSTRASARVEFATKAAARTEFGH
jgi:hypothetical protein